MRSSRPPSPRARRRSTRATGSWRSALRSRVRSRRPGSCSSARRRRRSTPSATSCMPAGSRASVECPRCRARSSRRRSTAPTMSRAIVETATRIGFPLLVKAAAGGGGRGMRRVTRAGGLPAALADGSAEALAAFGDGSVYLEREIARAPRRGPAACRRVRRGRRAGGAGLLDPASPPEARRGGTRAGSRRVTAPTSPRARGPARPAAGLRNAATAEFLLDPDGDFWFLEVNTRLQVEHGITELVSGVDIVREQLRIAAGEPLSAAVLAAGAGPRRRQGMRSRCASPPRTRRDSRRRLDKSAWVMPSGPGVRVEPGSCRATKSERRTTNSRETHGPRADRDAAIDRLGRALGETESAASARCRSTAPWRAAKRSARVRSRPAGSRSTGTATQPARPPSSGALLAAGLAAMDDASEHRTPRSGARRPMTLPRRRRAARRRRLAAGGTRRRDRPVAAMTDRVPARGDASETDGHVQDAALHEAGPRKQTRRRPASVSRPPIRDVHDGDGSLRCSSRPSPLTLVSLRKDTPRSTARPRDVQLLLASGDRATLARRR